MCRIRRSPHSPRTWAATRGSSPDSQPAWPEPEHFLVRPGPPRCGAASPLAAKNSQPWPQRWRRLSAPQGCRSTTARSARTSPWPAANPPMCERSWAGSPTTADRCSRSTRSGWSAPTPARDPAVAQLTRSSAAGRWPPTTTGDPTSLRTKCHHSPMAAPGRGVILAGSVFGLGGVWLGVRTAGLLTGADPGGYSAGSPARVAVLLAAGWALIASGVATLYVPARQTSAGLRVLAGYAWFIALWNTPSAGAGLFAASLIGAAVAPVLVGHAILRDRGRALSTASRLVVAGGYVTTAGCGLLGATFFDPA